jgi:hypothetical protein
VDSTISVKEGYYNLKPTDNKRELIFSGGKLVATKNKII